MKAFWCTPRDWDECSDIVFAQNRSKAIAIAIGRGEACNECEFIEVQAIRCKRADKYADNQDEIHKSSVWREIGGCGEVGEPQCDTCGLSTIQGEWPVCDDCHNCADCVGKLVELNGYFFCTECVADVGVTE